jgi:hypothetical protein
MITAQKLVADVEEDCSVAAASLALLPDVLVPSKLSDAAPIKYCASINGRPKLNHTN